MKGMAMSEKGIYQSYLMKGKGQRKERKTYM